MEAMKKMPVALIAALLVQTVGGAGLGGRRGGADSDSGAAGG